MKRLPPPLRRAPLAALLAALLLAAGAPRAGAEEPERRVIPPLRGPVVDAAGILSPTFAGRIEDLAWQVKAATGAELAVLIVADTAPEAPLAHAQRALRAWRLGELADDRGLLLQVAMEPRKVSFVRGEGLGEMLSDEVLGGILDREVRPRFREGGYGTGILAGLEAAARRIAEAEGVALELPGEAGPATPPIAWAPLLRAAGIALGSLLGIGLLVLAALRLRARRATRGFRPRFFGGGRFGGGFRE